MLRKRGYKIPLAVLGFNYRLFILVLYRYLLGNFAYHALQKCI